MEALAFNEFKNIKNKHDVYRGKDCTHHVKTGKNFVNPEESAQWR